MSYLFKPEIEEDNLVERDYQSDAVAAVREEFRRGIRRTLIVHPTGTGKGVVIAKLCRYTVDKGGRALVMTGSSELITDAANKIFACGITPGIEKAGSFARSAFDAQVVVGSVATLRGNRLKSWPRDHFKLVIPDEAHHTPARTWADIIDHFEPHAKVVGFTATPKRADDERLDEFFETIAHEYTIHQAMTAPYPGPYLSGWKFIREDIGIDLRDLKPGKGDFNADDLAEKIAPLVEQFANKIRERAGDRPTMVFAPNVSCATAFATAFQSMGLAADWVSGDDPDREYKVRGYLDGDTQYIVCNRLLTEGFNAPRTACVGLCLPTNSWALYLQMIGRGLRPFPNKDKCLILDFAWLSTQHDYRRPSDLFARELGSPEAAAEMDEMTGPGTSFDILSVIEAAKSRARSKAAERKVIEVSARVRDVKSIRTEVFDPFDGISQPPSARVPFAAKHKGPTPGMVAFLKRRGHPGAAGYAFGYAGQLIGMFKAAERSSEEARMRA